MAALETGKRTDRFEKETNAFIEFPSPKRYFMDTTDSKEEALFPVIQKHPSNRFKAILFSSTEFLRKKNPKLHTKSESFHQPKTQIAIITSRHNNCNAIVSKSKPTKNPFIRNTQNILRRAMPSFPSTYHLPRLWKCCGFI